MHEVPMNPSYNPELQVNNQDIKREHLLDNKTFIFHDKNYQTHTHEYHLSVVDYKGL
jgi:hypothetical protein